MEINGQTHWQLPVIIGEIQVLEGDREISLVTFFAHWFADVLELCRPSDVCTNTLQYHPVLYHIFFVALFKEKNNPPKKTKIYIESIIDVFGRKTTTLGGTTMAPWHTEANARSYGQSNGPADESPWDWRITLIFWMCGGV